LECRHMADREGDVLDAMKERSKVQRAGWFN
jgi:hypothetical protein